MIRPGKLRQYLTALQHQGIDRHALLAGSGIELESLDDPHYVVDKAQCRQVVEKILALPEAPAISLAIGQEISLSEFGILSHAMLSSQTLKQAAGYWIDYSNLAGMLVNVDIVESGDDSWGIRFSSEDRHDPVFRFCVEEMMSAGLKIVSLLTGQSPDYSHIELDYPKPNYAEKYYQFFRCPIRYNAPRCQVNLSSPPLSTPLPKNDAELNAICERHCSEVARQIRDQKNTLTAALRLLFLKEPQQIPSLNEAAQSFQLSSRTFRRRLAEQGLGYQPLVNRFRRDLALEYLKTGQFTQDQVAEFLGYSDSNAFRRAFKSWTGKNISAYLAESS